MASPLPDYSFKFQKIWLNATMKSGRMVPVSFKRDASYKCTCIDQIYGRPDPSCKLCYGTGYHSRDEIENRKWVMALTAPMDQETIQRYGLGKFTRSSRLLLISYPVSPEFTKLYEIRPTLRVKDADDIEVEADLGCIVQPDDKEARISYKEKLWNGTLWEVTERDFHIVAVESYKVGEFAIGQKVILRETESQPGRDRFLPKETQP